MKIVKFILTTLVIGLVVTTLNGCVAYVAEPAPVIVSPAPVVVYPAYPVYPVYYYQPVYYRPAVIVPSHRR